MNTIQKINNARPDLIKEITAFYDDATEDYAFWSKGMNMHYGYLRSWHQFFNRESMLEQLTMEVASEFGSLSGKHLLDLGCGTGASARTMTDLDSEVKITGINVVESHIKSGKAINRSHPGNHRINLLHADYHNIPLPDSVADGAYAMESMCHSYNKDVWLREVYRKLKPGAKVVVTDCFLRNPHKPMNRLSRWAYNRFRENWSVPHLAEIKLFETMAKDAGFCDVHVKDIRWNVAPSVFHSPFVVAHFLISRWLKGEKNNMQTTKNLKAVMLSIILGLDLRNFSYYMVTLTK